MALRLVSRPVPAVKTTYGTAICRISYTNRHVRESAFANDVAKSASLGLLERCERIANGVDSMQEM
jgi:hypothetical protein